MKKQTPYEIAINSFIPIAIKNAKLKASKMPSEYEIRKGADGDGYNHFWEDEFYHKEMNRLTSEAGLRVL